MAELSRYFLALIPPEPIYREVMDLKAYFRDQYNCKAPLRSPAHITLHMPFLINEKKEIDLAQKLDEFGSAQQGFNLELEGFGAFAPRVIYVAVAENPQLRILQRALADYMRRAFHIFDANYKDRGFQPHMTIAFRDLKKALFPQAWAEFQDRPYQASFGVDSCWLLKHDGKQWQRLHEFFLAG